jgi:subtilisin family serine protease
VAEPVAGLEGLQESISDQVEYIIEAFGLDGIAVSYEATPGGGVDYMYALNEILVRQPYEGQVETILNKLPPPSPPIIRGEEQQAAVAAERHHPEPVIEGVVLFKLYTSKTVPEVLEEIDTQLGVGIATPNHVLTVAGEANPCPATEPEEVYAGIEPYPSVCQTNGGEGVLIYLADTGLLRAATEPQYLSSRPWLDGLQAAEIDSLPGKILDGLPEIAAYNGHGTFVAGVTRCVAPAAEMIVSNVFRHAGSALESKLAQHLDAALGLGVDIFHLTVAAPSRKNKPMIALAAWLRNMRSYKGTACVVAAGNSGSRRPSWPAAFPETVAVGALAGDWRSRASFSNYGSWVDVYAPGRDLINAYATGIYQCHVRPYKGDKRRFYGMAKWSGTSFSTPIVTGLIAARMTRTGESAELAAAGVLEQARRQAIPGVGPIALPTCGEDRRDCGCAPRSCCCPDRRGAC